MAETVTILSPPPGFEPEDLEVTDCDRCGGGGFQELFRKGGFPVVACRACGLVQVNPRLNQKALLKKVYTEEYFTADTGVGGSDHFGKEAAGRRAKARRDLAWLAAHDIRDGKLFEIGSAGGFFVQEALKAGFDASGVDPEKRAARHAREVLGVPVQHGPWQVINDFTEPVEVFYLSHVLEHLPSPRTALRAMTNHLKPGGYIALEVPHWGSLPCQRQGEHWVIVAPVHHLYYFRTEDLKALAADAGLVWVDHWYPEIGLVDLFASSGALGAVGLSGVEEKKATIKKLLGPIKSKVQDALGWMDRTLAQPLLGKHNGVAVQVLLQKPSI